MKPAVALVAFTTVTFLLGATPVLALDASLHVSQTPTPRGPSGTGSRKLNISRDYSA